MPPPDLHSGGGLLCGCCQETLLLQARDALIAPLTRSSPLPCSLARSQSAVSKARVAGAAVAAVAGGPEVESLGAGGAAPTAQRASAGRLLESNAPCDVVMEQIGDKLKLLKYETQFCRKQKPPMTPVGSAYFALPAANPNEQFFYFTSLVAWLLAKAGRKFAPPGQFDDPNATCASILAELKDAGFAPPPFPPTKLKQGHGEAVCGVLDNLCDYALERTQFRWAKPTIGADAAVEESEYDNEGPDQQGGPEDFVQDGDDEEEALYGGDTQGEATEAAHAADGALDDTQEESTAAIESRVPAAEWRMEVERVAPQLRVTVVQDSKDWRSHLEQAKQHHDAIKKTVPDSMALLRGVEAAARDAVDKVSQREKYINSQFDSACADYRQARDALSAVQERYNAQTEGVAELTNEFARISEELEQVKGLLDERSGNISDSTPLVKIKTAIAKLTDELKGMEIRIGVAQGTLLRHSLSKNIVY